MCTWCTLWCTAEEGGVEVTVDMKSFLFGHDQRRLKNSIEKLITKKVSQAFHAVSHDL
jgi:hypothetical protein